ncbi:hypothetical protein GE061_006010 [Apolygus lucorum]|uniref:Uncharacterized protein n=1 Tax=Apolygus lucorum TaxID=248454 RepID=A0A8S9WSI6_APOLU|nr:hypothetical protein GE061_006010 [Apolygus lucorum]
MKLSQIIIFVALKRKVTKQGTFVQLRDSKAEYCPEFTRCLLLGCLIGSSESDSIRRRSASTSPLETTSFFCRK